LCVVGGLALRDSGANSQNDKQSEVDGGAPEVDGTTAEPTGEGPRESVGDELKAGVDQVELEGKVGFDAGLCMGVSG
jgi:hypothetical protein